MERIKETMKKSILVIIFGLISLSIQAQSQWYKTTDLAYRIFEDGYWSSWSDWESVEVNVVINLDKDLVVIYSKETQIYKVLEQGKYTEDSKGKQMSFKVVDQDYDIGTLRLRIDINGNSQIYIDFSDISWVYNVIRTN